MELIKIELVKLIIILKSVDMIMILNLYVITYKLFRKLNFVQSGTPWLTNLKSSYSLRF